MSSTSCFKIFYSGLNRKKTQYSLKKLDICHWSNFSIVDVVGSIKTKVSKHSRICLHLTWTWSLKFENTTVVIIVNCHRYTFHFSWNFTTCFKKRTKSFSKMGKKRQRQNSTDESSSDDEPSTIRRSENEDPNPKKSKWTNKQRLLVFGCRGLSFRDRHLVSIFVQLRSVFFLSKKMRRENQNIPFLMILKLV